MTRHCLHWPALTSRIYSPGFRGRGVHGTVHSSFSQWTRFVGTLFSCPGFLAKLHGCLPPRKTYFISTYCHKEFHTHLLMQACHWPDSRQHQKPGLFIQEHHAAFATLQRLRPPSEKIRVCETRSCPGCIYADIVIEAAPPILSIGFPSYDLYLVNYCDGHGRNQPSSLCKLWLDYSTRVVRAGSVAGAMGCGVDPRSSPYSILTFYGCLQRRIG